jgi:hypothetical protein
MPIKGFEARNLTMDHRALFEAQSAQIERRVAAAVVIKLRELKRLTVRRKDTDPCEQPQHVHRNSAVVVGPL